MITPTISQDDALSSAQASLRDAETNGDEPTAQLLRQVVAILSRGTRTDPPTETNDGSGACAACEREPRWLDAGHQEERAA